MVSAASGCMCVRDGEGMASRCTVATGALCISVDAVGLPWQVCRTSDGVCVCSPGWTGPDCSMVQIMLLMTSSCGASGVPGETFADAAGACCSGAVDASEWLQHQLHGAVLECSESCARV